MSMAFNLNIFFPWLYTKKIVRNYKNIYGNTFFKNQKKGKKNKELKSFTKYIYVYIY